MKEFIYSVIENKTKTTILRSIIFFIVTIVLIEQIYSFTKFVFKYNKSYDTGRFYRNVCDTNYVEYETERFQIADNVVKIKISHDNFNNKYDVLFLICSILITLFINYTFVYIFAETAFNNLVAIAVGLTTPFTGGITLAAMPLIQVLGEDLKEFFQKSTIFTIIMMIIKFLCMLYLVFIIPISIIVKLAINRDISILAQSNPDSSKTPNSDKSFSIQNILGHTFVLLIIWFMRLANYGHSSISKFTYTMFFVLFVLFYIIIMQIIDMYMQQKTKKVFSDNATEHLRNLEFSYQYMSVPETSSTFTTLIYNTLGLNNIRIKSQNEYIGLSEVKSLNKYLDKLNEKLPIQINSFNIMNTVWLFLLFIAIVIYLLLYFFKPDGAELYHIFDEHTADRDMLYYFVIIPYIFIFVIMFIITISREYNTLINKHILYNPTYSYKRKISEINQIFTKILENDKASVSNNSICKNIANAIHLSIYSNLFKDCDKSNFFVPQFSYVSVCTTNDFFSYEVAKEYDISTYVKDMFYKDNKCTTIDNELLVSVMTSAIPQHNGNVLLNQDTDEVRNSIKRNMIVAINNVMSKKTYDGSKGLQITNDYDANNRIANVNVLDTQLKEYELFDADLMNIIDTIAEEYQNMIMRLYRKTIYTLQKLCRCNNIENFTNKGYAKLLEHIEHTINNETNGKYSLNIKKDYVDSYNNILKDFFGKVNALLTKNVKIDKNNYKLSRYIIQNYNNYITRESERHEKKSFHEISSKTNFNLGKAFEPSDNDDISKMEKGIEEILKGLFTITEDIDQLLKNSPNSELLIVKVKSLDDNIDKLVLQKKEYVDLFKAKYYNNSDYIIQLIYDFRVEYINSMISLHQDVQTQIKSSPFYQNYDIVITSKDFDIKADVVQTRNELQKFDFEIYKTTYQAYKDLFRNQFEIISIIVNDLVKPQENSLLLDELLTNGMKANAMQTSSLIYALVVMYIIMIILANMIQ